MGLTAAEKEFKFRIFIKMVARNEPKTTIMREIGITEKTFKKWKVIDQNEEQFLTLPRVGGAHRKTTSDDDETLRTVALGNKWEDINDLRQLPELATNQNITNISDKTIKRRLKEKGVRRRVAANKELLTAGHMTNRLNYATSLKDWTLVEWSRGIFIDEFSYCTTSCGRHWVWRTINTRYHEENIVNFQATRRFSVSFIVCFSFHGIGPIYRVNRLTQESYTDFLENSLLEYIDEKFDDRVVLLLHDNHPVHTSNQVKDWISHNIGEYRDFVFPHPSLSPDLNPVENVGGMIKGLVRSERPIFHSNEELWEAIANTHQSMKAVNWRQYFINLLNSMPNRLQQVIENNGGHTGY